ncbi:MHYT domain-containing protein [Frankia nepalensis]|uniref:MHYT domain-containing protein n=1 Tax=Frankia nepalensis TaxID=1836974 RepID=UPI0027DB9D15|nr:MHYT domain-containing protein [Frankia nepalensis]
MAHEHGTQNIAFVAVSIGLALAGSFAALVSAIRLSSSPKARRGRWILASAVSLGGGAIWSMHFMGMLGYHVDGRTIVYDLPLTALSLVIAVGASALGLATVASKPDSRTRLVVSGVLTGLGVAAMHYTGMAAMHAGSSVSYDPALVAASVGIAVVAALAALWIVFRVRTGLHVALASAVMAGAVCGMHYTAMAATRVAVSDYPAVGNGADPIVLSFPVCVIAFTVLALIILAAFDGFGDSGRSPLTGGGDPRTAHESTTGGRRRRSIQRSTLG